MKKSKFTESQALKQAETGVPVAEVCRETGVPLHKAATTQIEAVQLTALIECWSSDFVSDVLIGGLFFLVFLKISNNSVF
ncbi:MAG: hypothetical protein M3R14_16200 [Acidobacteriota bacterium]|nr:hypothetical protein [Acidobacteriota bacterium]